MARHIFDRQSEAYRQYRLTLYRDIKSAKRRLAMHLMIMYLNQKSQEIQAVINKVFKKAYESLEKANIENK